MSYQPGDRFTQPIQVTSKPEGSRSLLTHPPTLPKYGTYSYPEQQSFAGQGMQVGNLQYQAAFSAEPLQLQQPQQISPQQYLPHQGQAIYNIGQQAPFSLQQYYAPTEPASSVPTTQTSFVTLRHEPTHFLPQTPATRSSPRRSYNVELETLRMGTVNTQEQQQVIPDDMDEAYSRYQQQLKTTFEAIGAGRLTEASVEIMKLSRWLLTNIAKLGFHQDEQNPKFEPIQVARDFNMCWLALGQKQKDLTEEAIRYRISDSSFLPVETIQAMVNELIRLCDSIERHGLVDYDRGVWEEEITSIFSQCLDLLVPGHANEAE